VFALGVAVTACWSGAPLSGTSPTVRSRPDTHDERFASVSLRDLAIDLRFGRLATYLDGPVVFLDMDKPQLAVLCGDDARAVVEQASARLSDPTRIAPHCLAPGHGYELSCGQFVFGPAGGPPTFEYLAVDFFVEDGGVLRVESVVLSTQHSHPFAEFVHAFHEAKAHAHCP
jgi:hypothetical protein